MAAAVERAWEIAEEFKRQVAGGPTSAEKPGRPTTEGAHVAVSALRHMPDPARIKDLSESPEKAAIAIAKTGLSIAVPNLAPIVGAAAKAVEKEVDRSEVPVHLP